MKKTWVNTSAITLMIFTLVGTQPAFTADSSSELKNELSQEIDGLYPKAALRKKAAKDVVAQQELDLENTKSTTIINNNYAPKKDVMVEEQPETLVEAAPLSESRVGKVKKARNDFEKSTEDTLVEKLEQDRIDAEKERAKRAEELFTKKEELKVEPVKEEPVVQPIIVQPAAPVATVVAVDDAEKTKPKEERTRYYISGVGGVGDYTSAKNVKGIYAAGVAFGMVLPENIVIEASAVFSSYDVTETRYDYYSNVYYPSDVQMDQQNFSIAGKYRFLDGRVKPLVGALVSYTHRTFQNKYSNPYASPYGNGYGYPYAAQNSNQNSTRPDSWAIDGGLLVGADVKVSEAFFMGADVRYIMNLSYRRDKDPRDLNYYGVYSNGYGTPIEELNYYIFTINGGFSF
ncbi:MAG: hypothetical protein AB7F59_08355 [Bdellovibrionales bacterium]